MIIECPSCSAKYQYDEERFDRKPSKRIKCARCQHVFEIHNPAFAPRNAAPAAAVGDSTFARKADDTRTATASSAPDTTEQSPMPQPKGEPALQLPAGKRLSLAILGGPDAGTVFRIERPRITIGRANADLTINDTEASRQHAALEIRETQYRLSDLGSTNGTLVDGARIEDAVELSDKSEFQVGATTLMLIVTDDH
ncbi:MAG TPA: FHA domain-containing protein [Thermoanaerobaculia bacterium]|nr:FHA domain-containing protein [Thermoanaerobaculia bacterium]